MVMKEAIAKVVERVDLSEEEAMSVMDLIMQGKASHAQVGALLAAMRLKGEKVQEITGFARQMRLNASPLNPSTRLMVDTCGTGGDGSGTFNISTTAAFVVAGAGVTVAKHGNRSVSSSCGSADLLESLGVNVNLTPAQVETCLEEVGIGFLFAPIFHGAMKHVAPLRRELGIRTIFNILGPLTNPALAPVQVLGVYDGRLTETMAEVLQRLGSKCVFVVHGSDGLDEVTVTGKTKVTRLSQGVIETYYISPEDLGFMPSTLEEIRGGAPEENARITRHVLAGSPGPCRDVVLANAAFALLAVGKVDSLHEGVQLAADSIDSGEALARLNALVEYTRSCVSPC